MIEDEDHSHVESEEETVQHIISHEKSAAGILCLLRTRHGSQASHLLLTKDVLGIVATLGKVDDDNLSRLLSEYLGIETMLAVVCKTYDGVKVLETYEKDGSVSKSSGLHGLGTSIGRHLDERFLVICLENLRPYVGEIVADDPQRKLDILKPRLPGGESPPGFLGFAVNMITIDSANLFCLTANGHGLRETLFYNLFSRLQVYKTRADMLQALPCITDGALSLDGGMVKTTGMFSLGNREQLDVKFPKSQGTSNLPVNYVDTEKQIKELKWEKERMIEDMQREQALLNNAKQHFEIKKQEVLKFMALSASYATQGLCSMLCSGGYFQRSGLDQNLGGRGYARKSIDLDFKLKRIGFSPKYLVRINGLQNDSTHINSGPNTWQLTGQAQFAALGP
ncbi:defective in meristem silencing 3 [Actinidia rufa]|uniref:Defective in meristem silencing 3 n=1 Tax=Actinidia rufa TaxID=165716 RepID=A0A7J0DBX6_9ERIC|nr:defective in meristem silencing 3 [Actinidia rufa]